MHKTLLPNFGTVYQCVIFFLNMAEVLKLLHGTFSLYKVGLIEKCRPSRYALPLKFSMLWYVLEDISAMSWLTCATFLMFLALHMITCFPPTAMHWMRWAWNATAVEECYWVTWTLLRSCWTMLLWRNEIFSSLHTHSRASCRFLWWNFIFYSVVLFQSDVISSVVYNIIGIQFLANIVDKSIYQTVFPCLQILFCCLIISEWCHFICCVGIR